MTTTIAIKEGEEVAVHDEQWLKPWQWAVGLVPLGWMVWSVVECVRGLRRKDMLVPFHQARRMHFLQLLTQGGLALVFGHVAALTWAFLVMLGVMVFLAPSWGGSGGRTQ